MTGERLTGGCLCGAIRYEVDRVFDVIYCHCSRCRKNTGAPVHAAAAVEGDAFRLTMGTPRLYHSSSGGNRCFCGECGSGLYFEVLDPSHLLARNGRYYSVGVGTLDEPERVSPQIHQFIENKLSWLNIADDHRRAAAASKLLETDYRFGAGAYCR